MSNEKTLMCAFAEVGCPRGNRCRFAHHASELKARMCPHGGNCYYNPKHPNFNTTKRPCKMFHPGDEVNEITIYERAIEFAKPISRLEVLKNTKMCRMAKTGCQNSDCNHAHTDDDCRVAECPYDKACPGVGVCQFYHPGVDKQLTRDEIVAQANHGVKFVVAPKDIGVDFVISIDEDELSITDEDFNNIPQIGVSLSQVVKRTEEVREKWAHQVQEKPQVQDKQPVQDTKSQELMAFLHKVQEEAAEKQKLTEIVMANLELFKKHGKWILEKL